MLALELLGNVLAAVVIAIVAGRAGTRLRTLARLPLPPLLGVVVDFLLGSLLLALLVLACGLAGLLARGVLLVIVAGLALAGSRRRLRGSHRYLLPAAAGGAVLLPFALAPPFFYDALVYHLGLPWQALVEGRLAPHPEDLFATFPPLAQLVSLPPLALGLDRAPALLHWWTFVLTGATLALLGRQLGAPRTLAALTAFAFPLLPAHMLVQGLPGADGWSLVAVIAPLAIVARRRLPPGAALVVGLLAGIACAARLQGIIWSGLLAAVVVAGRGRWRGFVNFAGGWVAGSAPWLVKNAVLLGQPWAPLGWRREGMETLWRDAGSTIFSSPQPWKAVSPALAQLAPHASYLVPLALAAVLAFVGRPDRRRVILALAVVTGVGGWLLTGTLARFLAPALGACCALAAAAGARRWGAAAAGLALTTSVAVGAVVAVRSLQGLGGIGIVAASPAALRQRIATSDPTVAFEACRALPANARVLLVGEPRGYGFPRRFVAPSQHDVSPLRAIVEATAAPAVVVDRLRRMGFTHLLVNFAELARLDGAYPVTPFRTPGGQLTWQRTLLALGPPVVRVGAIEVFALPSGP